MNANWKTVRVFISSTFRDMQAERDWLVRFVFPKLREELVKYRIHFVDVDLRWGVTGDQDALGVCREVIDECHPRFMCILGGRYGWVPAGQDKSITADEIHYGVLSREAEKRGHSFFYFRDDSSTALMVEETPGDFREPADRDTVQKLMALKKSVADAGLPVFIYAAQWDAAQKRLTGLEAFGNQVHDDLLQSLKGDPELAARFATEGTAPPDEFADEAEQMEAFIEERTERFVIGSREPLLRDMLDFTSADRTPNIFVLTGDPGSGKSAFLAKFARELAAEPFVIRHPSFVIPHFIGASSGSTDLRRTLRRLCHELALAAGNTEPLPLDIKDLITHFQKLLAEAASRQRVILVLDALNQFDATDGAHWLNWLPRELPPGVRIVASVITPADGQPEHQTLAILRTRPGTRMEKLEPLTEADTLAVIKGCLRRYAKRLSPEQLAALLAKPAGRLPLYVLTALEELRTLGTYEEITARIRELPGEARALFGWILTERLARDPGFRDREGRPCGAALVEKFAACLGVSRHGLSLAELAALLDAGDPLGNVAALLRLLRPYLMRRGELLDFYHGQFREAAEAAHLDTPEKQRAAHQSVATCLQAFADPHRDGQCRDATSHSLSELPHHQARTEAWPELIATLENIFFLEAKVTHGMAYDLVRDFAEATAQLPQCHPRHRILRLLQKALRWNIQFIARHISDYPQAVFQCLWNQCWWYDCPEAEKYYVSGEAAWSQPESESLHRLLESWRSAKEKRSPGFCWLRSLRPPPIHLGSSQQMMLADESGGNVTSVIFSPDGWRIVAAVTPMRMLDDAHSPVQLLMAMVKFQAIAGVRVCDTHTGATLAVLSGKSRNSVCLSADGRRTLIEAANEKMMLTDAGTWFPNSVCFSPDGRRILIGSADKSVLLVDADTGEELASMSGHEDQVRSVSFSSDGRWLVSGSTDKTARIWSAHDAVELTVLRGHTGPIESVCFSPDGERIVSASGDSTIRVWDAHSGDEQAVLYGHDGPVESVSFSPDGRRIVSGSCDKTVRLWDAEKMVELAVLTGHENSVKSVNFSPDSQRIVSGSSDKTVRLWDVDGRVELAVMRGHEDAVGSVSFSPDGRLIVTGSSDHTVRLWNADSEGEIPALREHERRVRSLCFSPDGRQLVSGSDDNTVRLWDAQNGIEIAVLDTHDAPVLSVNFSPDSRRIVSGSRDMTARVWDVRNGTELAVMRGHTGIVQNVLFTDDGQLVLSGSRDGTVRIWNASSGELSEVTQQWGNGEGVAEGMMLLREKGLPFRALEWGMETFIEEARDDTSNALFKGRRVAWFPVALSCLRAHPTGRIWSGASGKDVYLIALESNHIITLPPDKVALLKDKAREVRESLSKPTEFLALADSLIPSFADWLAKYPNVTKVRQTIVMQAAVDFAAANADRERLLGELTRVLKCEDLNRLVETTIACKTKRMGDGAFCEEILKFANACQLDVAQYPNLLAYASYMNYVNAIDRAALPAEFERFREDLIRDLEAGAAL